MEKIRRGHIPRSQMQSSNLTDIQPMIRNTGFEKAHDLPLSSIWGSRGIILVWEHCNPFIWQPFIGSLVSEYFRTCTISAYFAGFRLI
ncbi:hypothetical protein V6Z12_A05G172800 [Gossypium hirsutum]